MTLSSQQGTEIVSDQQIRMLVAECKAKRDVIQYILKNNESIAIKH